MNVFDENFQAYVQERATTVVAKVERTKGWKKSNKEYDTLHDIIYEILSEENKKIFDKLISNIWGRNDIEMGIAYQCRISRWYSNEKSS